MDRLEARKLGLKLRSEGKTYVQIAHELDRSGFKTVQGKNPQWYDVNYLLNPNRYSNYRRKVTSRVEDISSKDIKIVKTIIESNKLDAEKKVDLLKVVLEYKNFDIGL